MKEQETYWNEFIIDWDNSVYSKKTEKVGFIEKIATLFRGLLVFRMDFALESITPFVKNQDVLEIGCGTGRFSFALKKNGARHIHGIDISQKAIEVAKQNFAAQNIPDSEYYFEAMDLKDFTWKKETKDLVFTGLGILQYLSQKELVDLFKQVKGANFFFEFHENKWSVLEVIHTIYRNIKTGLPYYHKLTKNEIRSFITKQDCPNLYYKRVKGVSFFSSFPIDSGWETF